MPAASTATAASATAVSATRTAVIVAELEHQIEAVVKARAAEVSVVPATSVSVSAEVPLVMVAPEMGRRAVAEVPPVRDLQMFLNLHLRGAWTTSPGGAGQRRAAKGGNTESHCTDCEQFFDRTKH